MVINPSSKLTDLSHAAFNKVYLYLLQMEWRTVEIRDEKGDGFDTVQCEDMVFPKQFLHIQPEVRMKDVKELKYRDGDVLICSYPKTGNVFFFFLFYQIQYFFLKKKLC